MIRWPRREMRLWHPDSPGMKMDVEVLWPRYLWRDERGFATLGETIRAYKAEERREKAAKASSA